MFYTERDITIPFSFTSNIDAITAQEIRFILYKDNITVVDKRKTTGGIIVQDETNAYVNIAEDEVEEAGKYKIEMYLVDQLGDIRALTPSQITSTNGNISNISPTNPQICFIKSNYTE